VIERIRIEVEHYLASMRVARVEQEAGKAFDARRASFEARARELYMVDREKYSEPAQVSASHILFSLAKHTKEEGEKLAAEWRQRILAGEDFNQAAKEVSEDPSAQANGGKLGWFAHGVMDPAFTDATFALKKDGEISEPVLSRFGWHLIRRDGYKPARIKPYEEVRDQIMAEIRQKHVNEARDAYLASIRGLHGTLHEQAVSALMPPRADTVPPAQGEASSPATPRTAGVGAPPAALPVR
jgi:parvulin-like peptidyl-prolyl isomerase